MKAASSNFMRSIESMGEEYIYVCHIDDSPCVTAKKQRIARELGGHIQNERVVVVIKEIEGWYLAGASSRVLSLLRVGYIQTNTIRKEDFVTYVPRGMPRAQFMQELLKDFDRNAAPSRNQAFDYFVKKWVE